MHTNTDKPAISQLEMIVLLALMTSLGALSIDLQLPAMALIADSFSLDSANQQQWIITAYMLGFAVAQIFYGPISDSLGRKPVLLFGTGLYVLASVALVWVDSYALFLLSRAFQGVGAAAARIMVNAITRDLYAGNEMARITSLVMLIFIMVPVFAPSIGSMLLYVGHWHSILYTFIAFGMVLMVWSALRLPETLSVARRKPRGLKPVWASFKTVIGQPVSVAFAIISGLIFSGFMAYLNSAQQLFSHTYQVAEAFPYIFGGLALFFGLAAFINSKIVMQVGAMRVTVKAMASLLVIEVIGMLVVSGYGGVPPLAVFIALIGLINICVGLIFGNVIAIAMLPLGNHAGMGASVIGMLSALIAAILGISISQQYSLHVTPIVSGFLGTTAVAFILLLKFRHHVTEEPEV